MTKQLKCIIYLIWIGLLTVFLTVPLNSTWANDKKLVVGSKGFTEQRLLGQIMILLLEKQGFQVEDKTGLGGTMVVRNALESKQIDIYMEYTGTALVTTHKHKTIITDPLECYRFVKKADEKNGIVWLPYIPVNDTYCLMMRKEDAKNIGVASLSDLANYVNAHPKELSLSIGPEFSVRPDGYKQLQKKYGFNFLPDNIVKMSPGLVYKALREGQVQVAMGFTTDGRIKAFDLTVLEDDLKYFPVYNPAPLVKKETLAAYPELEKIFKLLAKHLNSNSIMKNLNYQVDGEHRNIKEVASEWLKSVGLI